MATPARLSAFAALNNSDSDSSDTEERSDRGDEATDTGASADGRGNGSVNNGSLQIDLGNGEYVYGGYDELTPPVQQCNFGLKEGLNVLSSSEGMVVGMRSDDILMLKGQYTITVISGSVLIDNYIHTPERGTVYINASNVSAIPTIIPTSQAIPTQTHYFQEPYPVIVDIKNYKDNLNTIPNLYPPLKYIYESENGKNAFQKFTFAPILEKEANKIGTSTPTSWINCFESIAKGMAQSDKPQFVLPIGNKNTGKSTFWKLLANHLLSKPELQGKTVQVIDADPGQPELCLPGSIAFTKLTKPLIGTMQPFRDTDSETEVKFIGFTSPNVEPLNYLHQLDQLITSAKKANRNTITMINAPGWVKGFGVEILSHLIFSVNLTHLVQLSADGRDLELLKEIPWQDNTKIIKLASVNKSASNTGGTYAPSIIRNFKLLSYMHYDSTTKAFDFNPLLFKSPYKISYLTSSNVTKIADFQGIIGVSIFDSQGVRPDDVPQALECQYVAVMTIRSDSLHKLTQQQRMSGAGWNINVIDGSNIHTVSEDLKFHGYAIVHSADTQRRALNLYTPIDLSPLKSALSTNREKLILVKLREDVIMNEIYSPYIVKNDASHWSSYGLDCIPYVSQSLAGEVAGGKTASIRRNIQRR